MLRFSFDKHQFHDCVIHGISFVTENFDSELHFEIDYIVDWPCQLGIDNDEPIFTISMAKLYFSDVTDMIVNINQNKGGYTTPTSLIYIDEVAVEKINTPLRFDAYYKFNITMTDGWSKISFGASDMRFELIGKPLSVNRQYLVSSERVQLRQGL